MPGLVPLPTGRRAAAAVLLITLCCAIPLAPAAELSISCGAVGQELALCRSAAETWAQRTGNQVTVVSAPNATNERLALYQQLLASGSADLDVLQIDVIWPGILAEQLLDLTPYTAGAEGKHFPVLVENNRIRGRLLALPWYSSVGLLFYRKDLLERYGEPVPRDWEQLGAVARRVQAAERAAGNARFWGYVWQGRAYEGLTCNALEWFASAGGGTLADGTGRVTLDNPQAAAALERAAAWVGDISPPGILNYAEEESRGVFQSGHALFMRNWPYAWALAQAPDSPVRDEVGVAPLPAATLGGWHLAVSRHSRHPKLAADLVLYLTSEAVQKRRAIEASYYPTRPALYQDADVLAANPFLAELEPSLRRAVARPSAVAGSAYNRLSSRTWNAVHRVLAGKQAAAPALKRLARELRRILRRRGP